MAKNEIALVKSEKTLVMQVAGKLIDDVEYKTLDAAIESLGKQSGVLTPEERVQAVDVVDKFQDRVVSCIDTKQKKLKEFKSVLTTPPMANFHHLKDFMNMSDTIKQILSDKRYEDTLSTAFHALEESMYALEQFKSDNEPEEPFIDEQYMTPAAVSQKKFEYSIKKNRYEAAVGKREFAIRKEFMAFKRDLDKNKTFKAFTKALDQQIVLGNEAIATVKEKASVAQMNIMISSEDVRKALREMHSWAQTI